MRFRSLTLDRRALIVLGAAALAWVPAACGTSGGDRSTAPTTSRPAATSTTQPKGSTTTTTPSDRHQTDLADHETPGLASQLTEVPGFRYVDISKAEVAGQIDYLHGIEDEMGEDDFFRSASFHSIVSDRAADNTSRTASGGREAAFVSLMEFSSPPPAGYDEEVVTGAIGSEPASHFSVAGTDVYAVEFPDTPDSRYRYAWLRHGVLGDVDGRDRAVVERWLRAYLARPEREPQEDDALAAQLRPVDGFAYANVWDEDVNAVADGLLDEGRASTHAVADAKGAAGVLWLIEQGSDLDATMLAAQVAELAPSGLAATSDVDGTTVATSMTDEGRKVWAWSSDHVLHVLVSTVPDRAQPFVDGYLSTSG